MTNPTLKQFVENQVFESKGFPQGDTFFNLETATVERTEVEFNGTKQIKFLIIEGDKSYMAPPNVFKDIKAAAVAGFKRVRITRTGLGKEGTKYTTIGVNA
jgi:hypothetical protein